MSFAPDPDPVELPAASAPRRPESGRSGYPALLTLLLLPALTVIAQPWLPEALRDWASPARLLERWCVWSSALVVLLWPLHRFDRLSAEAAQAAESASEDGPHASLRKTVAAALQGELRALLAPIGAGAVALTLHRAGSAWSPQALGAVMLALVLLALSGGLAARAAACLARAADPRRDSGLAAALIGLVGVSEGLVLPLTVELGTTLGLDRSPLLTHLSAPHRVIALLEAPTGSGALALIPLLLALPVILGAAGLARRALAKAGLGRSGRRMSSPTSPGPAAGALLALLLVLAPGGEAHSQARHGEAPIEVIQCEPLLGHRVRPGERWPLRLRLGRAGGRGDWRGRVAVRFGERSFEVDVLVPGGSAAAPIEVELLPRPLTGEAPLFVAIGPGGVEHRLPVLLAPPTISADNPRVLVGLGARCAGLAKRLSGEALPGGRTVLARDLEPRDHALPTLCGGAVDWLISDQPETELFSLVRFAGAGGVAVFVRSSEALDAALKRLAREPVEAGLGARLYPLGAGVLVVCESLAVAEAALPPLLERLGRRDLPMDRLALALRQIPARAEESFATTLGIAAWLVLIALIAAHHALQRRPPGQGFASPEALRLLAGLTVALIIHALFLPDSSLVRARVVIEEGRVGSPLRKQTELVRVSWGRDLADRPRPELPCPTVLPPALLYESTAAAAGASDRVRREVDGGFRIQLGAESLSPRLLQRTDLTRGAATALRFEATATGLRLRGTGSGRPLPGPLWVVESDSVTIFPEPRDGAEAPTRPGFHRYKALRELPGELRRSVLSTLLRAADLEPGERLVIGFPTDSEGDPASARAPGRSETLLRILLLRDRAPTRDR